MKVRDVCAALEQLAPSALAYDWDRSGLNIGEMGADVSTVLIALDVTAGALGAAKRAKAQMIVSHHPVVWNPLKTLRTDDPHTRLCLDLAHAGIACYSAHTNLDVVPKGVNDAIAERLGLKKICPLFATPAATQVKLVTFVPASHLAQVRDAVCRAGAGVIGAYTHCTFSAPGMGTFLPGGKAKPFSGKRNRVNEEPELRFETLVPRARLQGVVEALRAAHPYEEVAYDLVRLDNLDSSVGLGARGELEKAMTLDALTKLIRKKLELAYVRVVGSVRGKVIRVAVLGGSGGSEVENVPSDIDVYVTGDVRHHDALNALERGLAVVDAGHAGMEKWVLPALRDYLRPRLSGVRVIVYNEPDPFRVVTR
ncbi:MAG: Nif3-like dinuclear metal center hexameric protein [Candidatus Hydrogenedentes bacterium]|nr:Nif3-like dinuclear metal center hexameric protein [Candidatus Hydrogenedentota bacterium]